MMCGSLSSDLFSPFNGNNVIGMSWDPTPLKWITPQPDTRGRSQCSGSSCVVHLYLQPLSEPWQTATPLCRVPVLLIFTPELPVRPWNWCPLALWTSNPKAHKNLPNSPSFFFFFFLIYTIATYVSTCTSVWTSWSSHLWVPLDHNTSLYPYG